MMDRIEFLHSMNRTSNLEIIDIVMTFFDQYMCLYNLVSDAGDTKINIKDPNYNSISFEVHYSNEETANRIFNSISMNKMYNIYGSLYNITPICRGNKVNINILKVENAQ